MKKMMLMVAMFVMAAVVMAAGTVRYSDAVQELYRLANVEKNAVAAQAYMADINWTESDDVKNSYVWVQMSVDRLNKVVPVSVAETKTYVAGLAAKVGVTDQQLIERHILGALYRRERPNYVQDTYDYYKTMVNPVDLSKAVVLVPMFTLKKYDECLALSLELGNYDFASKIAATQKDKAKVFEYSRKAILDSGFATAQALTVLLDRVNSFDYAGTTVTPAMLLDLATATNRKYSNFLVKDKVAWEPVITGLRTTIEEMKKDVK